jgi:hypothetical protein
MMAQVASFKQSCLLYPITLQVYNIMQNLLADVPHQSRDTLSLLFQGWRKGQDHMKFTHLVSGGSYNSPTGSRSEIEFGQVLLRLFRSL